MAVEALSFEQIRAHFAGDFEDAKKRIFENWQKVQSGIEKATVASGRKPSEVRLVGVTKYVDAELTGVLAAAGCQDFGENRPQALWRKAEWFAEQISATKPAVRWHQIGHLQRNKVRRLLRVNPLIHSLDSTRLLDELHQEAVSQGIRVEALIEVNISGDPDKTGLPVEQCSVLMEHFRSLSRKEPSKTETPSGQPAAGLSIIGLMAMAGRADAYGDKQSQFAAVRELRDSLQASSGIALPELSMGMSNDFEAAIAEGATLIRIGSNLFEGLIP